MATFTSGVSGGAAAAHGAISLEHDTTLACVNAVPAVIAAARSANYTLVSMDDCVYGASSCVCAPSWASRAPRRLTRQEYPVVQQQRCGVWCSVDVKHQMSCATVVLHTVFVIRALVPRDQFSNAPHVPGPAAAGSPPRASPYFSTTFACNGTVAAATCAYSAWSDWSACASSARLRSRLALSGGPGGCSAVNESSACNGCGDGVCSVDETCWGCGSDCGPCPDTAAPTALCVNPTDVALTFNAGPSAECVLTVPPPLCAACAAIRFCQRRVRLRLEL